MSSENAVSRWLQAEMPRRGYPIQGRRAGGISRLAEDADIPQATMSRLVNGRVEPSLDTCRRLARAFGIPLDEVLVRTELVTPDEFRTRTPSPAQPDTGTPLDVSVPPSVSLPDLRDWERHIWVTPGISVELRRVLILFARLQRGDLADDTNALLRLTHALNRVVGQHLERGQSQGPPQAG